jgi:hypothetical protein
VSQALKASVLVNHPDKSNHDKGCKEALQLATRAPLVTDRQAISLLQNALEKLQLRDEASKLWQRVTGSGQNVEMSMELLDQCIEREDWIEAQKVCEALWIKTLRAFI